VKLLSSRAAIFGSLLCGAVSSAAFRFPLGWAITQFALMGGLWLLQGAASHPGRAAGLGAAFSFWCQRTQARANRYSPKNAQAGQIMAPAIVLLFISCGLFYLMINSSQAVNEKVRVTNAADAAAYSAGVVEARALNYYAYTNRAMVANQIVIAQMVSFASWMRYFAAASQGVTRPDVVRDMTFLLQPSWGTVAVTAGFDIARSAIESAAGSVDAAADAVQLATGAGVFATDLTTRALSASQTAVAGNLLFGVRQTQVANSVATEIDAALRADLVPTTHGFDRFTKSYTRTSGSGSVDERGRLADVVTRSRDAFSRQRSWTTRPDAFPTIWGVRRNGELRRRGGTDLVGFDEWRSVDTLELHGEYFGSEPQIDGGSRRCRRRVLGIRIRWWCGDIQKEVGAAAINVNTGGGDAGRGVHGNAYRDNPRSAVSAERRMNEPTPYAYSGIPSSRDLLDLSESADRTTGITFMVSKQHGATLTSGGLAQARPSGQLALFGARPAGGQVAALSRAQVFFDRIETRSDNRAEIGSLYNPYWRVRLVAPTLLDRTFAADRQGGLALP
jgi:Putative Flp pilus-assembly TadE/G-like